MIRAITILFVLMTASFVQAQALAIRTTGKQCTQNGCRKIIGTGACAYIGDIDDKSIYITAAHVVRGTENFSVGYAGRWWGGRVSYIKYDDDFDYAIIETRKIPAQKCFEVAEWLPVGGSDVVAYGYSKGIYKVNVIRSKVFYRGKDKCLIHKVDYGDSGGPVISRGKVVGIIHSIDAPSTPNGLTYFSDVESIVPVIKRIYGRLPLCNCRPLIARPTPKVPIQPKPDPLFYDNSKQVAALEGEISKLREQLDRLSKTKIPVEIYNAEGKVISKQKYPLGDPIKLRFKAVKK